MNIIVSKTGVGHGWGSDPWKWVSHLTADERRAVRAGQIVLITGCPPESGNSGSTLRQVVIDNRGGYTHRIAPHDILDAVGN